MPNIALMLEVASPKTESAEKLWELTRVGKN